MMSSLLLFAEVVDKVAAPEGGIGSFFQNPAMIMIVIMGLFFFIVILPAQRRQKREAENLLANLKKNDEVVTTSGIIGIVANIKEGADEVTLKIDDNARIRILRTSIARIVKKDEPAIASIPPSTDIKPTA